MNKITLHWYYPHWDNITYLAIVNNNEIINLYTFNFADDNLSITEFEKNDWNNKGKDIDCNIKNCLICNKIKEIIGE